MSERGRTAVLALGALLLFFVLMFGGRSGGVGADGPSRPTTIEAAANGYTLLRRWLEDEGVPVLALRERLAALPTLAPAGPRRASLLILTLPGASPIETRELRPLDEWLRAGNTLLVLAALSDAPSWSAAAAGADAFDLKAVTGLEFESVPQRAARFATEADGATGARAPLPEQPREARRQAAGQLARPARSQALPVRADGLLEGVESLLAESDFPSTPWAVRMPFDGLVFELARDREQGEGVLWMRQLGRGRIIVSAYGSLLTNRAVGLGKNGRFFANLIAASVGPEGVVIFDDGHQGLSPSYDPQQLFGDRRLHLSVLLMIALWLLWVLGSTRLRTPQSSIAAPRPVDLIRSAGGFFARVLPESAGARRLCEHFLLRLRGRIDRSRGTAGSRAAAVGADPVPWEWLEQHPRIAAEDVRQLREWYGQACMGRRVPLERLHNLLLRLDRQVA